MLDQVLGVHGLCSSDVHYRESLIHGVNHSSLGEAFLCRHRGVWPQCSQQPLPGPKVGKEKGNRLLVPVAVSHLQPLQKMLPRFLWDVLCLLCWPWQPTGPAGVNSDLHRAVPQSTRQGPRCCRHFVACGRLLQPWSSSTKQSVHYPVHRGSVKWLMLCAVHGIYLVQIAEGLSFNVHWKDIGTRFWTALCSLP